MIYIIYIYIYGEYTSIEVNVRHKIQILEFILNLLLTQYLLLNNLQKVIISRILLKFLLDIELHSLHSLFIYHLTKQFALFFVVFLLYLQMICYWFVL